MEDWQSDGIDGGEKRDYNMLMDSKTDLSELIEDFLEHLEIEAGRSRRTTENYRLYLERFLQLAQEILNRDEIRPGDITKELLRKYRLKLNRLGSENGGDDLKTITQAYHLIALRGFLKYLAWRDIKSLDPSLVDCRRWCGSR